MIRLEKFTENEFDQLIDWVDNAKSLVQFAGPIFSFPLTHDQLNDYLKHKDKIPLKIILNSDNTHIGHCEINLGNKYPRLSRILIGDPGMRGRGIGKEVVKRMVEKIFNEYNSEIIDLNVFAWNKQAIKCYEGVHFRIIEENTDKLEVHGIEWKRLNMQTSKSQWNNKS